MPNRVVDVTGINISWVVLEDPGRKEKLDNLARHRSNQEREQVPLIVSMSRLSHHHPPLHPPAGWLKYWPDKAEETEDSHESQASRALLDTPGMSPQPLTLGGASYQTTGIQKYGEPSSLWGRR